MVRVAGLKRRADMGLQVTSADGLTPRDVLARLAERIRELVDRHARCFRDDISPQLADEGIHIRRWDALDDEERARLAAYFRVQGLPGPHPARRRPGAPVPLHLRAVAEPRRAGARSATSEARALRPGEGAQQRAALRGRVPEPRPRPSTCRSRISSPRTSTMLFPGMEVVEHHLFRVTRNADFEVEEDRDEDLLQALERELMRRRFGPAVRLEVADDIDDAVVELLVSEIDVEPDDVLRVPGLLDLSALLAGLRRRPAGPEGPAVRPGDATRASPRARRPSRCSRPLREGDVLVHHPYESFATSVQRFIEQAAADPHVLAIKQTLYRTSGDSPIVDALIDAAEAGKQVVALVEIKARFDEQANIKWARALERAGCHVVYGFVGLKTHCKTALVVRQEGNSIRRYAHIGTGNYNPKTARMYEDLGLFTADEDDLRRHHRPVQRAHRLLPPDRVPIAAGRAARHPVRVDRAHRDARSSTPRPAGPGRSGSRPTTSSTSRPSTRSTARRGPACRSTCWCAPSARSAPACPGCRRTSRTRSILGRFLEHSRVVLLRRRRRPAVLDRLGRPHAPQPRPPRRGLVPGQRPRRTRPSATRCSTPRSTKTRSRGTCSLTVNGYAAAMHTSTSRSCR